MSWPTLPSFSATNIPSAAQLNLFNDAFNHLHTPVLSKYEEPGAVDFTTTSPAGTWVAISGGNYSKTITMSGGHCLVLFSCVAIRASFDLFVDSVQRGDATVGSVHFGGASRVIVNYACLLDNTVLPAGSHTLEMKWCRRGGVGTATISVINTPRFYVMQLKGG